MRATVHLWLSRLDSRVSVITTLSRVLPTLWRCWGARPRTPSTTLPPRASRDPLLWPMPTRTSLWPLLLMLLLDSKAPNRHGIPTTPPSRQAAPIQQHRIARNATILPPPMRRRRLLQTGPASKQRCPDCRKSAAQRVNLSLPPPSFPLTSTITTTMAACTALGATVTCFNREKRPADPICFPHRRRPSTSLSTPNAATKVPETKQANLPSEDPDPAEPAIRQRQHRPRIAQTPRIPPADR